MARHCLEITSSLDPRCGGICASLPLLAKAVAAEGRFRTTILVAHGPDQDSASRPVDGVPTIATTLRRVEGWTGGPGSRSVRDHIAAADLLHIHGLWETHSVLAARWARRLGRPFVVSVHGMLERWALKNKWWKKQPYWRLVESRGLRQATCLRALTRTEVDDYRRLALRNPIAVIPYGLETPEVSSPGLFLQRFPTLAGQRLILFLGRIHYKKGVDLLCRAWAGVSRRFPEAHLVLAGPDFESTRATVEALVRELKIQERVSFTGMLAGELKWSALAAAEVFVLPSYSEGLPVAVLEALGMGKPVIITRPCNLAEVGQAGCGWVVEPDVAQLKAALTEFLQAEGSLVRAMGASGRRLFESRYTCQKVGAQMAAVYEWILGGPAPAGVEIFQ